MEKTESNRYPETIIKYHACLFRPRRKVFAGAVVVYDGQYPRLLILKTAAEQQDEMYGKGMRVMNLADGKKGSGQYCCTVCGERVNR